MYKKSFDSRDKLEETNNAIKDKNKRISDLENRNNLLQKELYISNQEIDELTRRIN